jgi:hypothetical protein
MIKADPNYFDYNRLYLVSLILIILLLVYGLLLLKLYYFFMIDIEI